ncbi:MAG: hypothetical protein M3R24_19890 [Chloroflexota bacterium]|nr:hypothetical protein [Chloroflexota bacterium]
MPEQSYTAAEQALFERELESRLRAELLNVREEEIKAAAERAAQRELEQRRMMLREELDSEVADTTVESPTELRDEANREAPSKLVVGLIMLILLLFLLVVYNRGQVPGFGSASNATGTTAAGNSASGALEPILSGPLATPGALAAQGTNGAVNSQIGSGLPNAGGVDARNSIPSIDPNINPLFVPFYYAHDGLRVFGRPLGPIQTVNGRQVQWFERTRLEQWPEYAGTSYEVQSGLVGLEYTDGRSFPTQAFFTSRPGLRFFPETSHGVGGKFLDYWETHGGLDIFGYPISDELVEILPETKQYHTVQYFQRARMELHPQHAGTPDEVQLGLLGRALYLNEAKSAPVPAVPPTPVPLP